MLETINTVGFIFVPVPLGNDLFRARILIQTFSQSLGCFYELFEAVLRQQSLQLTNSKKGAFQVESKRAQFGEGTQNNSQFLQTIPNLLVFEPELNCIRV